MSKVQYVPSSSPSYFRYTSITVGKLAWGYTEKSESKKVSDTKKRRQCFQLLPTELLLHIFSFLELKPYIISHGVSKEWNQLLPFTDLHSIRRRLLDFYRQMIKSPHLMESMDIILRDLRPFDRQAYIDALYSQYPVIPEEFLFWILEWPERLAIGWAWPGLPVCHINYPIPPRINWLGYRPHSPQLLAVVRGRGTPGAKFIPALLIWRSREITRWLIFDKDDPDIFGMVFQASTGRGQSPCCMPSPDLDSDESDSDADPLDDYLIYPDWISCQKTEFLKQRIPKIMGVPGDIGHAKFVPFTNSAEAMPCPTWPQCHLPMFQAMLC